jgi:hypothetical protein
MPQNDTEAAYIAFAVVDELIRLLVVRGQLDALSVKLLFESVAERLLQENNLGVNRAAQFVANRMPREEGLE